MKLWWIENKLTGKLVKQGRHLKRDIRSQVFSSRDPRIIPQGFMRISEEGMPNPQQYRRDIKSLCYSDERPVKVKLIKVS